ncbi:hypothetical protein [Streptomyces sp. CA2R106]|uniref:hypothetical protein n=1 Tax=Streptomyces sp. CA2R106 TaxID=3120153 RepID=UPI00300BEEB7
MTDEERELSALLERVVPQLPAPVQRLDGVRERMRRRGRRRAAVGASAVAVAVVAAAGLLLPSPGGGAARPAASGQRAQAAGPGTAGARATAGRATTAAPGPTGTTLAPPPVDRVYAYGDLAGLRLTMPADWYTLKAGTLSEYAATQQLAVPTSGCDHARDDFCTPLVRRLDRGGTLLQFRLKHDAVALDEIRRTDHVVQAAPVVTACRTVGGTTELTTTLPGPQGSDVVVTLTACLAAPSAAQLTETRDVLTSADLA